MSPILLMTVVLVVALTVATIWIIVRWVLSDAPPKRPPRDPEGGPRPSDRE